MPDQPHRNLDVPAAHDRDDFPDLREKLLLLRGQFGSVGSEDDLSPFRRIRIIRLGSPSDAADPVPELFGIQVFVIVPVFAVFGAPPGFKNKVL